MGRPEKTGVDGLSSPRFCLPEHTRLPMLAEAIGAAKDFDALRSRLPYSVGKGTLCWRQRMYRNSFPERKVTIPVGTRPAAATTDSKGC